MTGRHAIRLPCSVCRSSPGRSRSGLCRRCYERARSRDRRHRGAVLGPCVDCGTEGGPTFLNRSTPARIHGRCRDCDARWRQLRHSYAPEERGQPSPRAGGWPGDEEVRAQAKRREAARHHRIEPDRLKVLDAYVPLFLCLPPLRSRAGALLAVEQYRQAFRRVRELARAAP